jgi:hypothetical protein
MQGDQKDEPVLEGEVTATPLKDKTTKPLSYLVTIYLTLDGNTLRLQKLETQPMADSGGRP